MTSVRQEHLLSAKRSQERLGGLHVHGDVLQRDHGAENRNAMLRDFRAFVQGEGVAQHRTNDGDFCHAGEKVFGQIEVVEGANVVRQIDARHHNYLPRRPVQGRRVHGGVVWNNGKQNLRRKYYAGQIWLRRTTSSALNPTSATICKMIYPQTLRVPSSVARELCNLQRIQTLDVAPPASSRRAALTRPNGRLRAPLSRVLAAAWRVDTHLNKRRFDDFPRLTVETVGAPRPRRAGLTPSLQDASSPIRRPVVHVSLRKGDSPMVMLGSRVAGALRRRRHQRSSFVESVSLSARLASNAADPSPCRSSSRQTARAFPTWRKPAPLSLREVRG